MKVSSRAGLKVNVQVNNHQFNLSLGHGKKEVLFMANLAVVTYNRKTQPNRKTSPVLVKLKGTNEVLHPRELIENIYEKMQLSEKIIQVFVQDERKLNQDGMDMWIRQAYYDLRNKMMLNLEYKIPSVGREDEITCKQSFTIFEGKEQIKDNTVELVRKEQDKFQFSNFVERGKIDPNSLRINHNGKEQQSENKATKFETVPDQRSIREKSEIEADLKEVKSWIQRDEEEAQKLMNKDQDKSKIIEEIQKKIEENSEEELRDDFKLGKSFDELIDYINSVNYRFVVNEGQDEDTVLCVEVFKAFSFKLQELFKCFSWQSNFEQCQSSDLLKVMCGTSMCTRQADIIEMYTYLKKTNYLPAGDFDPRTDVVSFPKFLELFLRVVYKKFLDEKSNGDQVFTQLYKELSENVFQNNCAFTNEFLVKDMEEKHVKAVKKQIGDLISIQQNKFRREPWVEGISTLSDKWLCETMMKNKLSDDDFRKLKQDFRKITQKNLMNFEVSDKEAVVLFFADQVNALLQIANKMTWKDSQQQIEAKESLQNSEGKGRLTWVLTTFTTDTQSDEDHQ